MKKLCLVAGIALLAVFAGCANAPALPSLQQQFVQACPIVNADLGVLAASPYLTVAQQDTIKQALSVNTLVCASGAKLDVTSLKTIHDSLLPIVVGIVSATPAIPNQPVILLGLQLFGPIVQGLVDQAITTVVPAVPATPAAPASAASGTLVA